MQENKNSLKNGQMLMEELCFSPFNKVLTEAMPAQHTQQVLLTSQLHPVLGKVWCTGRRRENWKTNVPSYVKDGGGGKE